MNPVQMIPLALFVTLHVYGGHRSYQIAKDHSRRERKRYLADGWQFHADAYRWTVGDRNSYLALSLFGLLSWFAVWLVLSPENPKYNKESSW